MSTSQNLDETALNWGSFLESLGHGGSEIGSR